MSIDLHKNVYTIRHGGLVCVLFETPDCFAFVEVVLKNGLRTGQFYYPSACADSCVAMAERSGYKVETLPVSLMYAKVSKDPMPVTVSNHRTDLLGDPFNGCP